MLVILIFYQLVVLDEVIVIGLDCLILVHHGTEPVSGLSVVMIMNERVPALDAIIPRFNGAHIDHHGVLSLLYLGHQAVYLSYLTAHFIGLTAGKHHKAQ